MTNDSLQTAKKNIKNRAYAKAVQAYEQYMSEESGPYDPDTYASYGKALRMIGRTHRAKEVLETGNETHSSSELILQETSTLYEVSGDWQSAKTCAETLININPHGADHHIRLGGICTQLAEYDDAKTAYQNGLAITHGLSIDTLIETIQCGFADNPDDVTTRYEHIGGMNNLGAFVHEYGNQTYLTKITKYKGTNKREAFFYKELCATFPVLQQLTPNYIDSRVMDGILYLTIEKVNGTPPVKLEHFQDALGVAEKMASVSYGDLNGIFELPNYAFQFNLRNPNIVAHFFTQIHQKKYNDKLFRSLRTLIDQKTYPDDVYQLVDRLENLVIEHRLYDMVEPDKHYTLMHGEFKPASILIDETSGMPHVIDWSTFTIGPRVVEIARYLSAYLPAFSTVEQLYLNNDTVKLTLIERMLFLYAITLFYILRLLKTKDPDTRKQITTFMETALDRMEQLLASSRFAETRKQQQLEERITTLERENKQLKRKLSSILNSKSWRITAPLRNIVERLRH